MPGRQFNNGNYRYGFNGQEKDDEVKGVGNSLDFGDRMLDTRLGRWFSPDPLYKKYPGISAFTFCADNPIYWKDKGGRDLIGANAADREIVMSSLVFALGTAQKIYEFNEDGKLVFNNSNYDPSKFSSQQNLFIKEFNEQIVNKTTIKVYVHNDPEGKGGQNVNQDKKTYDTKYPAKDARDNAEYTFINSDDYSGNGKVDLWVGPQITDLFEYSDTKDEGNADPLKVYSKEQLGLLNEKYGRAVSFFHGLGHAYRYSIGDPGGRAHEQKTVGFENTARRMIREINVDIKELPMRAGTFHGETPMKGRDDNWTEKPAPQK